MIPRYARPQMTEIWSDENRFRIWLEIEIHACDAQAQLGVIPQKAAQTIRKRAKFDSKKIAQIEKETKHDVIAFLTSVAESVGEESRFIHQGLTSSDILDTALAVQLVQASNLLIDGCEQLLKALAKRTHEHKYTPTIGRSHGIHAEPITFGLKLAGFYAEFARAKERLVTAREEIATCKLSGAVGTYAHIDPKIESYVAERMGLKPETHSTQVIPRDRHAMYFATLGVVASSIERLAVEIRHLQRTEMREAEEYFSPKQKGSSAMPHKRNPVLAENLTGLARIVRAAVTPALENVALWHERDISHSSVERVFAPDATIALDFALHRLTSVIKDLVIYPEAQKTNLEALGGLIHSQQVLLLLTQKGVSREDAYKIVQHNAMKVWEKGGSYLDYLKADKEIMKIISADELENLFTLDSHFGNIDFIFERVFGKNTK